MFVTKITQIPWNNKIIADFILTVARTEVILSDVCILMVGRMKISLITTGTARGPSLRPFNSGKPPLH